MDLNINFSNSTTFRILYLKYKEYILPSIFGLLGILIFFYFTLSNIQNYQNEKSDLQNAENTLSILNKNLNIATSLSTNNLDNYTNTVTSALPQTKDFEGILNSIADAENKSGVSLGDYNFQIGDLKTNLVNQNSIGINLTILGGATQVEEFLGAIKNELPLNNITQITIQGVNTSLITVSFYYDPTTTVAFNPVLPLSTLSTDDLKTIRDLSVFNSNFYNISSQSGILSH